MINQKPVADFQTHLIAKLRAEKDEANATTQALVEASRANMNSTHRFQGLILCLLESQTEQDFLNTLTLDSLSWLDVDASALAIESAKGNIPVIPQDSALKLLPSGTVDEWMAGANVLLHEDITGSEALYGGGAALVKSQILLRLNMEGASGILAFGSRDPKAFSQGQATDQAQFLAGVVERLLVWWQA